MWSISTPGNTDRVCISFASHPLAQELEETFTRPLGFTKPRKAWVRRHGMPWDAMGCRLSTWDIDMGLLKAQWSSMVFEKMLKNGVTWCFAPAFYGSSLFWSFLGGTVWNRDALLQNSAVQNCCKNLDQSPALRARTRKNRCIRFSCRHPQDMRPTVPKISEDIRRVGEPKDS